MSLYSPKYGASCGFQILSVCSHMCFTVFRYEDFLSCI